MRFSVRLLGTKNPALPAERISHCQEKTKQNLGQQAFDRGIEKEIKGQRFWTNAEAIIKNFELPQHFCDAVDWQLIMSY